MMRSDSAEDRAFLRALARDVVALKAPNELDAFESLVARYFAHPLPQGVPQRFGGPPRLNRFSRPCVSEVVPATLVAVLNFILLELEMTSFDAPREGIWQGLKRVLLQGWVLPGEGLQLRRGATGIGEQLRVVVYCYSLPVGAVFEVHELLDIVESTSAIYGLDEDLRRGLGQAVLARLCRNVLAR
jgi:hypothetical protein